MNNKVVTTATLIGQAVGTAGTIYLLRPLSQAPETGWIFVAVGAVAVPWAAYKILRGIIEGLLKQWRKLQRPASPTPNEVRGLLTYEPLRDIRGVWVDAPVKDR